MSSALCRLLGFLRRSRFRPAAPPARERIWPGHPDGASSEKRPLGLERLSGLLARSVMERWA